MSTLSPKDLLAPLSGKKTILRKFLYATVLATFIAAPLGMLALPTQNATAQTTSSCPAADAAQAALDAAEQANMTEMGACMAAEEASVAAGNPASGVTCTGSIDLSDLEDRVKKAKAACYKVQMDLAMLLSRQMRLLLQIRQSR